MLIYNDEFTKSIVLFLTELEKKHSWQDISTAILTYVTIKSVKEFNDEAILESFFEELKEGALKQYKHKKEK